MDLSSIDRLADQQLLRSSTTNDEIDSLDFTSLSIQERWPAPLAEAAFIGPLGAFVKLVEPNSEASAVALLLTAIVNLGNLFGRDASHLIESDLHCGNEFLVLVGNSAIARKGTADGHVSRLFQQVDEEWHSNKASGLSSGEGLIFHVRDAANGDVGIIDKRLLITETEFANCLKVMSRDTNTLSAVIRNAWDGQNLRTLAKNHPVKASRPHISIVGHITSKELNAYLNRVDVFNGFANRFLWAMVKRSKILPFGGRIDDEKLKVIAADLKEVLKFVKGVGELRMSDAAEEKWPALYTALSSPDDSLSGVISARASSHVKRLAIIYAVSEKASVIELRHLDAALAVWSYCAESAQMVFGKSSGDPLADRIFDFIKISPDGRTQSQISRDLFSKNKSASEMGAALLLLREQGKIAQEPRGLTDRGRPRIVWKAI